MASRVQFKDEDFEGSSTDFDDDEDPDLIEVPGGGRDLVTAVIYSKNFRDTTTTTSSSPTPTQNNKSINPSGGATSSSNGIRISTAIPNNIKNPIHPINSSSSSNNIATTIATANINRPITTIINTPPTNNNSNKTSSIIINNNNNISNNNNNYIRGGTNSLLKTNIPTSSTRATVQIPISIATQLKARGTLHSTTTTTTTITAAQAAAAAAAAAAAGGTGTGIPINPIPTVKIALKSNIPATKATTATTTTMPKTQNNTSVGMTTNTALATSRNSIMANNSSISNTTTTTAAGAAAAAVTTTTTTLGNGSSSSSSSSSSVTTMPTNIINTLSAASSYLNSGTGNYLNSLSTSELMSLAAFVASKGGSNMHTPPPPNTATSRIPVDSSATTANSGYYHHHHHHGGGAGGTSASTTSAANFASLLAQMSFTNDFNVMRIENAKSMQQQQHQSSIVTSTASATAAASGSSGGGPMATSNLKKMTITPAIYEKLQKLLLLNPQYVKSGIPNHLLEQLYHMPSEIPTNRSLIQQPLPQQEQEEEDYEEIGVAETYADYWPAKLMVGTKHPDPVVETASLSSVEPCDVHYKLSIPAEVIRRGQLSALQLESITYASQAHENILPDGTRAGFLIGDGAGVGKGRTIAGIIYENYLHGRKKALWISVSTDLKYDAERDLNDIGAGHIEVNALNKFKYARLGSEVNSSCKRGVIFSTYSALIGESSKEQGKYRSRFRQLIQWCGENFDGLIIFDECHKAKNLCPASSGKSTKTGQTVLALQEKLPRARIVYASATGASEPRNMAYMVRLGLWGKGTSFDTFNDFASAVERRGICAMEIVAMDMKLRGMYIARQLSFKGVSFKIEEVPLSKEFRKLYDDAVELWVEAMHKVTESAELIAAEGRMRKTMWGQFWSAHQRFFKYLCIAAKVNQAVLIARESIKYGKCVVIGLQSTGESRTLEQLDRDDGELTDFVSTAKGVFQTFVERHFPAPDRGRINKIMGLFDPYTEMIEKQKIERAELKLERDKLMAAAAAAAAAATGAGGGGGGEKAPNHRTSNKRKRSKSHTSNSSSSSNHSDSDNDNNDDDDDDDDDDNIGSGGGGSGGGGGGCGNDSYIDDGRSSSRSSDFNPFFTSDSDVEPWVGGRSQKKQKKRKKKKVVKTKKKNIDTTATAKTTTSASTNTNTNSGATAKASGSSAGAGANKKINYQSRIRDHMARKASEFNGFNYNWNGYNGFDYGYYGLPPENAVERAMSMKEDLLHKIEELGCRLPPNTLDQLIDELGGPDNVAEMTGRRGRVVATDDGTVQYETRTEADVPLETLNVTEKQRFMNGEKDVAIISEAASSGISLQSDRRVYNQRRRVHITLELPWSADRAIQQFGRTHRSNQVNAPEYIFLISDLAGERRFASTVAKRLESLGALTHGDRRATETRDLSQFNIDNKYGRQALERVMRTIMGYEMPMVEPPKDYDGDFLKDVAGALVGVGIITNTENNPGVLSLDKDYQNISKFLNRILGCPVDLQNRLFKYFTDTMTAIIEKAKRGGRFDLGILDLGAGGEDVTKVRLIRFMRKHTTGVAPIELHTVRVERGMLWADAYERFQILMHEKEGFYISHQVRNKKRNAILVSIIESSTKKNNSSSSSSIQKKENNSLSLPAIKSKSQVMCQIFRPNTGVQVRHESLAELEKKYRKVTPMEAMLHWKEQYEASVKTCSHAYWNGLCRNLDCQVGLRQRLYHVLAGSVLSVWPRVELILNTRSASKVQVIRVRTVEGQKIVGTMIPKNCLAPLVENLGEDSTKQEEFNFVKSLYFSCEWAPGPLKHCKPNKKS